MAIIMRLVDLSGLYGRGSEERNIKNNFADGKDFESISQKYIFMENHWRLSNINSVQIIDN